MIKIRFKYILYFIFDVITICLVILIFPILYIVRKFGIENFRLHLFLSRQFGFLSIRNHYYEPRFVYHNNFDFYQVRKIPFKIEIEDQCNLLNQFYYKEELSVFTVSKPLQPNGLYVNNPNFGAGDVDLYYLIIRKFKPKKIIEIGSGYSTMVCLKAIEQNQLEGVSTELTCIEPFEMPFLNQEKNITSNQKTCRRGWS